MTIHAADVSEKKGKIHVEMWVGDKNTTGDNFFKTEPFKSPDGSAMFSELLSSFDVHGNGRLKIRLFKDKSFIGKAHIDLTNLPLVATESTVTLSLENSKKKKKAAKNVQGQITVKYIFDAHPWQILTRMSRKRAGHTATLLVDGDVLVCGGVDEKQGDGNNSAELWNGKTYEFHETYMYMTRGRAYHTATRLKNGKVLICGGYTEYSSVEMYDPKARAFTACAPMKEGRYRHSAALLGDGRVLIVGGLQGDNSTSSCEVYDPKKDQWELVTPAAQGIFCTVLCPLHTGDVFMVGGTASKGPANNVESSFIFYHNLNTWGPGPIFPSSVVRHSAVVLATDPNKVVVTPGSDWYTSWTANKNAKCSSEAFIVEPLTKKINHIGRTRTSCGVVAAINGDIVVALGGETLRKGVVMDSSCLDAKVHLDDNFDSIWDELEPALSKRFEPVGVPLGNGYQVLLFGGINGDDRTVAVPTVELFDFRGSVAFKRLNNIITTPVMSASPRARAVSKSKSKK